MNLDQITSGIRSVLKVAGGYLVAKGLTDNAHVEELIGAAATLTGLIWSWTHHSAAPTVVSTPDNQPTQTK